VNLSNTPAIISAITALIVLGVVGYLLYTQPASQATITGDAANQDPQAAEQQVLDDAEATALALVNNTNATTDTINQTTGQTSTTGTTATTSTLAPTGQRPAAALEPASRNMMYSEPPEMIIDPTMNYTATIVTPRGNIVLRLYPEIAPQTVNNFVFLARQGFYDGLTWHRVLEDFMAQGGDPTGSGTGGAGYNVPAEFTDQLSFDQPGMLAMARANDINSASSQFFITTAPTPWLNEQYTIFGEVVAGQEIVNNIPLRDPATATQPGEMIERITISSG
jgi:peptidylprolyl isomerase